MDFAGWLRSMRARRGPDFSQEDLAVAAREIPGAPSSGRRKRLGFSQGRISQWECGGALPDLRQLACVCIALEVPRDERRQGKALWEAAQLDGIPVDGRDLFDAASDHDSYVA